MPPSSPNVIELPKPSKRALTSVGLVAVNRVCESDHATLLSRNEWLHCQSFRDPARRRQWLAGRLLCKHLILNQFGERDHSLPPPLFIRMEPEHLGKFPEWSYKAIEILGDRISGGGRPRVSWAGRPHPIHMSIAHTGNVCCACVDPASPIGVDVELPAARSRSFYEGNFSVAERQWAAGLSSAQHIDVERVFMLLWCLKECTLKSGHPCNANLWDLSRIEIRLGTQAEAIGEVLRSVSLGERVFGSEFEFSEEQNVQRAEMFLTSSRDAVLTVVRRRKET